jgi:ATP-dependent Clp endopeptidase proteolytic subunit ClpP
MKQKFELTKGNKMFKKPSGKKSAPTAEEEFMNSIKQLSEPQEKGSRKIGLYGQLDTEKAELVVYSLLHLHDTRMKSVPRPLSPTQKKKLEKAIKEDDMDVGIDVKFDEVSQPLEFVISTPGGSASDMFSIYDTMRMVRKDCDIQTLGLGQVMSAGTLLLASGTKGKRKIGKHCRVMVHQVSAGTAGPHHEMVNEIAEIQHTQEQYIRCLAAETKMSVAFIKKLFEKKVNIYLSAEEAVKYGLADIII